MYNNDVIISLDNVGCTFFVRKSRLRLRRVDALRDINLQIHRGETLGIIGCNGSGKSTLLQVIGQILAPTLGSVYVRPDINIALLSLSLGFSQELTGRENAILGAMYLGYSHREAQDRIKKILDFAEIGEWVHEPVRTYSTGMRMRLAFAVAMEMKPDIMLIDEVLGVGDAYFQQKSSKALMQKMQSGQTSIVVSHSEATIRELCSRVVWLHEGRVRKEGAPNAVVDEYNVCVAQLPPKNNDVIKRCV